ncbi:MAG: efflux RND transporter periplasmic adaptor subunit [Campylobacteraceae bacterium]
MNFGLKIISVLMLGLVLNGCSNSGNANEQAGVQAVEVGYITVSEQAIPLQQEISGRVKAKYISDVRPQIDGIIKEQKFKEGSFVKKGDILYIIDPDTYEATYESAVAALKSAEADLATLKLKSERYDELLKIEGISKQNADDARAAYLQGIASVEQNKASVKSAKINLDRTKIKAQISGYIGVSSYTAGALVSSGQSSALATIRYTDSVYLDLSQSNTQLFKLKKLLSQENIKKGSTEINILLPDGSVYKYKGVLQLQEVSVDESTGFVTLRAEVPNTEGELLNGMFVTAIVESAIDTTAYLIPQQAVLRDAKSNPIITTIRDNNTVEQKIITTERAIGKSLMVTSGAESSDKIIIEGLGKVNTNSIVSPVDVTDRYANLTKVETK